MIKRDKFVLILLGTIIFLFGIGLVGGYIESTRENPERVRSQTEEEFDLADLLPRPKIDVKDLGELRDEDIIFVRQHTNWADGFYNECYYINAKGEVRWVNLSEEDEKYSHIDTVIDYLQEREDIEPVGLIHKETLEKYYKMYLEADKYAKLEEIPAGNDYGQNTVYGIGYRDDGEKHVQTLHSYGDTELVSKDEKAREAGAWLEEKLWDMEWELMGTPREIEEDKVVFVMCSIEKKTGIVKSGYYINGKGDIYKFQVKVKGNYEPDIYYILDKLPELYGKELVGNVLKGEMEEKYHTLFQRGEVIANIYQEERYDGTVGDKVIYSAAYAMLDYDSIWLLAHWENGELKIPDSHAVECVEWVESVLGNLDWNFDEGE